MVLALAALFLQPVLPAQVSFSAEKIARLQRTRTAAGQQPPGNPINEAQPGDDGFRQ
jgi:hypothetical protein